MDNLQYSDTIFPVSFEYVLSFKPYYKWIIFNINIKNEREIAEIEEEF